MVSIGTIIGVGALAAAGIGGYVLYVNRAGIGGALSRGVQTSLVSPFNNWLNSLWSGLPGIGSPLSGPAPAAGNPIGAGPTTNYDRWRAGQDVGNRSIDEWLQQQRDRNAAAQSPTGNPFFPSAYATPQQSATRRGSIPGVRTVRNTRTGVVVPPAPRRAAPNPNARTLLGSYNIPTPRGYTPPAPRNPAGRTWVQRYITG